MKKLLSITVFKNEHNNYEFKEMDEINRYLKDGYCIVSQKATSRIKGSYCVFELVLEKRDILLC